MNPWLKMWQLPFANYDQNINPVTTWFSPQYTVNIKGDAAIEAEVQTQVASFGTQLGKLTGALLELADGKPGAKLQDLRELQRQVEELKARHGSDKCARLRQDLQTLKEQDLKAFTALVKEVVG